MSFPNTSAWFSGGNWPAVSVPSPARPAMTPQPALPTYPTYPTWPVATMTAAPGGFFAPPPSYPASNAPAMWTRLHPYIAQSPTLCRQLAHMAQAGWTVQWGHQQGSSCDHHTHQLVIDVNVPEHVLVQTVAHEASHVFDSVIDARLYATESAYADAMMRKEAVALINHMRVRSEIFQGSGVDIGFSQRDAGYYEGAVVFHQRHGNDERLLQHVQRMMPWDLAGRFARCYWEVFLNFWRGSRGLPLVAAPAAMVEARRAQAWAALATEINAG